MDEDLFREAYRAANPLDCVFQKALLNQSGQCTHARPVCLADRQGIHCQDAERYRACQAFLDQLRDRARFALRLTRVPARLPHAQEIRVQLGGLRGARRLLDDAEPTGSGPPDVAATVGALAARYGGLERVPYESLVSGAIDVRRRRR